LRSARAARLPLVPEVSLEPVVPELAPDEPLPLAPIEDEEPVEPEALGLVEPDDDELPGLVDELEPEVLGLVALEPEAPMELLPPLLLPLALGVVLPLVPVLDVSAAVLGLLALPLEPEAPIVLEEPVEPEPAGAVLEPVLEPVPAPTPVPTVPPAPLLLPADEPPELPPLEPPDWATA
jgi:hypothetical protein